MVLQAVQLVATAWLAHRVLHMPAPATTPPAPPEALDVVPGQQTTGPGLLASCEVDGQQVQVTVQGAEAQAVWARTREGWRALHGGGPWRGPAPLGEVGLVRVWIGQGRGVHPGAIRASAMLTPWPAPTLAPTRAAPNEEEAGALLDTTAWRAVVTRAARGGLLGLPSADEVAPIGALGEVQAACWLAMEIGKSHRSAMPDRSAVERCELLARAVLAEAASLVEAIGGGVRLEVRPPPAVSVHDERWLVDQGVARAIGNPVVNDLLQPLVVLRPAVLQGDTVLLVGEVA